MVIKSPDTEKDGENYETGELYCFPAQYINGSNVHIWPLTVANGLEHRCRIQTKAVESYIQEEPRACSTQEDLSIFPFTEVGKEVCPTSFGDRQCMRSYESFGANLLVCYACALAFYVRFDIYSSLLDVTCHIKGISGRFWYGETVIKSETTRNRSET